MKIKRVLLRLLEHMPQGDDLELIVLKGHLLLEERLETILRLQIAHGGDLEKARLSFTQKVDLARAMSRRAHDSELWDIIFQVNSIRNDLVHHLEPPKLTSKIDNLTRLYLDSVGSLDEMREFEMISTAEKLRSVLVYLLGFLGEYEDDVTLQRGVFDRLYAAERERSTNS